MRALTKKRVKVTLTLPNPIAKPDKKKSAAALSANFIQSFDAAIITELVKLLTQDNCRIPMIAVHDMVAINSYHVDRVHKSLLKVNYDLFYNEKIFTDFLQIFDEALLSQGAAGAELQKKVRDKVDTLLSEIKENSVGLFPIADILEAYCMYY